jgi:hypothetical protein
MCACALSFYLSLIPTLRALHVCVCLSVCVCRELSVWTSNMRRAKDTAKEVKAAHHVEWRSLREIEVSGVVWSGVVWCCLVWCGVMWCRMVHEYFGLCRIVIISS